MLALVAAFVALKVAEGVSNAKAGREQMKGLKARRRIQEIQNAIARRDAVQDAFQSITKSKANAEAQGASTSSVAAGAVSSLASQLSFNIQTFEEQGDLQQTAFDKAMNAQKLQGIANIFGSTASIVSGGMGIAGRGTNGQTNSSINPDTIFDLPEPGAVA